jgi:hypothetical protein
VINLQLAARPSPGEFRPCLAGWASGAGYYADCMRSDPRTCPLDLDIGDVADGYHLIVRSISLTGANLLVDWVFVPDVPEDRLGELWPNMSYDADVSPRGWNQACGRAEWYERPVPEARYAWLDFFRPDYGWMGHFDRHGQPDGDYLRNRIARLTFDLRTGEAQIDK